MKKPKPELSSDYNASLPDCPQERKKPEPPPNYGIGGPDRMSLSSRNTITFLVLLGIALFFMLAYAASR